MSHDEAERVRRQQALTEIAIVLDRNAFGTRYLLRLSRVAHDLEWPPRLLVAAERLMAKIIKDPDLGPCFAFELQHCSKVIELAKVAFGRTPYMHFPRRVVDLYVQRQQLCEQIGKLDREIGKLMTLNETDLVDVSEERLEGEVSEEDRELFKL